MKQISERGRDYEASISIDYLKRLNEGYDAWIEKYDKGKLLVIDMEDNAFHNDPEDLGRIISRIDAEIHGLFPMEKPAAKAEAKEAMKPLKKGTLKPLPSKNGAKPGAASKAMAKKR